VGAVGDGRAVEVLPDPDVVAVGCPGHAGQQFADDLAHGILISLGIILYIDRYLGQIAQLGARLIQDEPHILDRFPRLLFDRAYIGALLARDRGGPRDEDHLAAADRYGCRA